MILFVTCCEHVCAATARRRAVSMCELPLLGERSVSPDAGSNLVFVHLPTPMSPSESEF